MSENIYQIYQANPITLNNPNDLMYFGQYPYGANNDAAMTYSSFIGNTVAAGNANNLAYYGTAGQKISPLALNDSAMLVTNATGVPQSTSAMTNGQIIIGNTSGIPAPATLTAGANIVITNGANSIQISTTGAPGISWNLVTGTSAAMVADGGYVPDNSGLVTLTLPTVAGFGTVLYVVGFGSGGWTIAQNAGQGLIIGSSLSTVGTGGSVSSTNRYDSLTLLCVVANTTWVALGAPQSSGLTIV